MNNGVTYTLIFSLGAAVGSIVTWRLLKTKYEQIAQEEIDSVKAVFSRRYAEDTEPEKESADTSDTHDITDIREYAAKIQEHGYTDYTNSDIKPVKEVPILKKPYVISPNECGELDDYEIVSLVYYADGILTDDWNEIIENVDDVVGCDSLNHFGEYEEDSVFVRNEDMCVDYEILRDPRNYTDVVNQSLHLTEDE